MNSSFKGHICIKKKKCFKPKHVGVRRHADDELLTQPD